MLKKIFYSLIIIVILAGITAGLWLLFKKQPKMNIENKIVSQEVVSSPADDKDWDGVKDEEEKKLGLSTRDADTDGDGLLDTEEMHKWQTDPKKVDTDGDGYWDGYEILNGYNPNGSGALKK